MHGLQRPQHNLLERGVIMMRRLTPTLAAIAMLAACSDSSPVEPALDGLVGASVGPASLVNFTATDVPVALLDPGRVQVVNKRYVINGMVVQARFDATDPRMSGFATITGNGVLDVADGSGPVWGKMTLNPDGGGTWVGTWHGHRAQAGTVWIGTVEWNLNGRDGIVGGLHARGTETITTFTLLPTAYFGQIAGTIR
jgi:hypothetical protein